MINIKTNSIDLILINNKENNNVNEDLIRIMKPGAYLFSFDKSNKAHNSVCDIEDMGFIIKDSISYFFKENEDIKQDLICLAMKPLSEKNFAENVMKWGTGGLNIDGCRIGSEKRTYTGACSSNNFIGGGLDDGRGKDLIFEVEGRYPANFIISEDVVPVLDKQSGYSKSTPNIVKEKYKSSENGVNTPFKRGGDTYYKDEGGASRFFYNAKSYKDLLRYIIVLGLPPKESKVLFIGFNNVNEIIEEINKESNVKYEAIVLGGDK